MSTLAVNAVTDANGGNTATINSMTPTADSLQGFRNRIINGDMRIDQRRAGAAVTVTDTTNFTFMTDRWAVYGSAASKFSAQQNAGSVTPPVGFVNYLGITSLSAYSVVSTDQFTVNQLIEGLNTADLAWGTANAKTVTLSFWVRSSLTGTFGGGIRNSAGNRAYPYTYTINAANTWEYKTVTIPGDTSGTWLTTNGVGIRVGFSIGTGSTYLGTAGAWAGASYTGPTGETSVVGTNGATWYITGVQLEVGSVATPFERRPYGTELALCQRYYYRITTTGAEVLAPAAFVEQSTRAFGFTNFPVTMRTAPTALEQTGTASDYVVRYTGGLDVACSAVPLFNIASVWGARTRFDVASGLTGGQSVMIQTPNTAGIYLGWSAEL